MAKSLVRKIITATEASNRFGTMIDEAAVGKSVFVVTRLGQPRAVIMGVEQYRELLEALETAQELDDEGYMSGIAEAREDIRLGRTLTLEELDRELGFGQDNPSR